MFNGYIDMYLCMLYTFVYVWENDLKVKVIVKVIVYTSD